MLSDIRERFTGKPALVVLGVLAFSFVFFGIGEFTFLGGAYAAKVDDTEISVNQLQRAYQNQLLQYSDYGNLPAESRQILKANSLERLIRDTLVELHVRDEGYRISDVQIAEIIQSEAEFQHNGVFSKDVYYSWLDVRALNARTFEAQQARSIRTGQLLRGIGATAFVTASEYRRYLNLYAEQRQATIAVFDMAALADTVVVHDEDVSVYYDARPDDFNTQESVDFEYLEINRAVLSQEIEIAENVLQQYYEDSASRFLQDEQRQARHILITVENGDDDAAEQQAVALTARIQAGEPFEDLARQYSKDGGTANSGGDLGVVMQSQMPGALGSAIFTMTAGEVLGPVRTDFGFHIVRLDSILDGGPLPLEQIRNELLQELRSQGVEVRARELTRQLSDALFDASELQSVSASSGLAVQAVTGFSRTGGEPFGDNQAVIEAVFDPRTLLEGQISDLIDVDVNRSVMIRVTQHHEQARQPLAEVRESIEFALQSERAVNMIEDRSRRLVEALEAGRDFAEIANELEATYTPNVVVGRRDDSVDRAVLNAIFQTKKPAPGNGRLGSIVSSVGDYAVFMVTAVIPGRPESVSLAERDRRKEELQAQAGNADLNAFVTELMRNADIERNQDVLSGSDILQ